ncbi:hypothetical protein [Halopiger goleimassiliensis]|uniref:hypothetical protein n=1 Tax=Halopiger goleimassiliensis TaxID=1293048 RepID=UPI0006780CA1|nr:hypothetical protein [Halopiger goleimassiliensis]
MTGERNTSDSVDPPERTRDDESGSGIDDVEVHATALERAEQHVEAADEHGAAGRFDAEDQHLAELALLASETDDPDVRTAYARALVNATDYENRDGIYDLETDCRRLEENRSTLERFYEDYPEKSIARRLAHADRHLAVARAKLEAFEEARRRRTAIRNLYDEHGGDETIAEHLAAALAGEAKEHARHSDDEGPCAMTERNRRRVEALYDDHATDGVASALASLYSDKTVSAKTLDEKQRWLDRLDALYEDHPTDDVAGHLAWARSVRTGAITRARLEAVETETERLERLYENRSTDAVAAGVARALDDVLDCQLARDDRTAAGGTIDRLREYYESHRDESEVQEALARSLHKLAEAYANAGSLDAAENVLEDLERLFDRHPDTKWVWGNYANACLAVGHAHVEARNLGRARELMERDAVLEWHDDEEYEELLGMVRQTETVSDPDGVLLPVSPILVSFYLSFLIMYVPRYVGGIDPPFNGGIDVVDPLRLLSDSTTAVGGVRTVELAALIVIGVSVSFAIRWLVPEYGITLSFGKVGTWFKRKSSHDPITIYAIIGGFVGCLYSQPSELPPLAATMLLMPVIALGTVVLVRALAVANVAERR